MITRTYYYIEEESTDPFYNLAIEQHLLDLLQRGTLDLQPGLPKLLWMVHVIICF